MLMKETFAIQRISTLRERARGAAIIPWTETDDRDSRMGRGGEPESREETILRCWSKSPVDPMQLLRAFPALRIREGMTLRAYLFRQGGNGNGRIWAMPEAVEFPEPVNCEVQTEEFLSPPKPPGALDDYMDAIEGDGYPWSYLCASLFAREAAEFGALWHGCWWSDVTILGEAPSEEPRDRDEDRDPIHSPSGPWEWLEPKPTHWEPSVEIEAELVTARFFCFNPVGTEMISLFEDRFVPGRYVFESTSREIATGPGGIIY